MRAIRVQQTGGPEVLRVENVPDPQPAAGEVLVAVEAVGVNFIEIYQRSGGYPMTLPFTPGSEAAGTVRAVGAGVTGFAPGDRVTSTNFRGAYAELAIVPADRAVKIPDGVTTRQAAAVMLQGMTAHYLSHSTYPLRRGETCLIHAAAGGVGLLLVQMAKRIGATVIATAGNADKLALARRAGADHTIDYGKQDWVAEVKRLTQGAGVAVVYDSVGKSTFDRSLDCLARRGMMVLFGQSSGAVSAFDPQILNRKGSLFLTRPTLGDYIATRAELESRANAVLGWVADGSLDVRIGAEYPLDRAGDAHAALAGRQTTGKVLLSVPRDSTSK